MCGATVLVVFTAQMYRTAGVDRLHFNLLEVSGDNSIHHLLISQRPPGAALTLTDGIDPPSTEVG